MNIDGDNSTSNFGIVIPGRMVNTQFQALGPTRFVTQVMEPSQVTDLTFFILPNSPIPPGFAAVLYFAVPPFENWQVLGSVSYEKPSATLRTSWPTNPEVTQHNVVQLGVSIESLESVQNMGLESSGLEERKQFAHKIALDLFRYMTSFSSSSDQNAMIVPTNVFDRWMTRFEQKYKRDPNFMMKIE